MNGYELRPEKVRLWIDAENQFKEGGRFYEDTISAYVYFMPDEKEVILDGYFKVEHLIFIAELMKYELGVAAKESLNKQS